MENPALFVWLQGWGEHGHGMGGTGENVAVTPNEVLGPPGCLPVLINT